MTTWERVVSQELQKLRENPEIHFVDAMANLLKPRPEERWNLATLKSCLGDDQQPGDLILRRWLGDTEPIFSVTLPPDFPPIQVKNLRLATDIAVLLMTEGPDGKQDANVLAVTVLKPNHKVWIGIRTDAEQLSVENGVLSKLQLSDVMEAARTQTGLNYYEQLVTTGQDAKMNFTTTHPTFSIFDSQFLFRQINERARMAPQIQYYSGSLSSR